MRRRDARQVGTGAVQGGVQDDQLERIAGVFEDLRSAGPQSLVYSSWPAQGMSIEAREGVTLTEGAEVEDVAVIGYRWSSKLRQLTEKQFCRSPAYSQLRIHEGNHCLQPMVATSSAMRRGTLAISAKINASLTRMSAS